MSKLLTINEDMLSSVDVEEVVDDNANDGLFVDDFPHDDDYDAILSVHISISHDSIDDLNYKVEYAARCLCSLLDSKFSIYEYSKIVLTVDTDIESKDKYNKLELGGIVYHSYATLEQLEKPSTQVFYFYVRLKCHMRYEEVVRFFDDLEKNIHSLKKIYGTKLDIDGFGIVGNVNRDSSATYTGFSFDYDYRNAKSRYLTSKAYRLFTYFGTGGLGQYLVRSYTYKGYYHPFCGENHSVYINEKHMLADVRMKPNCSFDRVLFVEPVHKVAFDASYNNEKHRLELGVVWRNTDVCIDVMQDLCDRTMDRIRNNNVLVKAVQLSRDVYDVFPKDTNVLYLYLRGTVFNDIKEYVAIVCVIDHEHTEESITRMLGFVKNNLNITQEQKQNMVDLICNSESIYADDATIARCLSRLGFK